jgi:hypothetical protein
MATITKIKIANIQEETIRHLFIIYILFSEILFGLFLFLLLPTQNMTRLVTKHTTVKIGGKKNTQKKINSFI